MRTALAATAMTALALFTAAPVALAGSPGSDGDANPHATQAERLMRAADRFDARATAMRGRATRLRATALELRQEAEDLVGDQFDDPTTDPTTEPETDTDPSTAEATARQGDDTGADDGAEDASCDWDGEDNLGFSRHHEHDDASANAAEACQLLRLADRLEQRAGALDTAADRLQGHATKLRDKAKQLLAECGETQSQRLLKQAGKLRTAATRMRAHADALRETAFDGASIDDETVTRMHRLELRAAAFDRRADRLEARAAKLLA